MAVYLVIALCILLVFALLAVVVEKRLRQKADDD